MPKELSPAEREALERWAAAVREALGVPDARLPVGELLGLTGRVAREAVRPAVPPTAYLMGFAVGRAVAAGADQETALREALAAVAAALPGGAGPVPDHRPSTVPDTQEH